MTFTRVQHNSTNPGAIAASLTATLASGVTAGNLLVATITLGTNGLTITPPSGWTQAGPTEAVSGSLDQRIYYLVVGTGGATSFTWSWSGSHSFGWTIDEWNSSTGWASSPVDITSGGVHTTASTAVNAGSPSTTTQGSELWYGVLSWADSGQTLSGVTSGWTTGDTSSFASNNTSTAFYQTTTTTGTPSLAATISALRVNAGVVATFKASTTSTHSGTASLSGQGTLGATGVIPGQVNVSVQTADEVATVSGVATSVTSFSPPAGSMVFISATWLDATDQLGKTFTCADNHGNSYSLAPGGQGGDGDGGCYLLPFQFQYSSAPGATHVTITASGTGATATADCLIQPYIVTNQNADQSTAAHNKFAEAGTSTNTYEISLTPTALGSVVFVLGAPNNNNHPVPVAISGTVTDADWDDDGVGSHGVVGRGTPTTSLTSTTYGWTSTAASVFGYGVLAVEVVPVLTVLPTAGLSGQGSFSATGTDVKHGAAALTGQGTFGITGIIQSYGAALEGEGTLSGGTPVITAPGTGNAVLSGTGTLGVTPHVTYFRQAALTGVGTFTAQWSGIQNETASLTGVGTFSAVWKQGYTAGLTGVGTLSIPQVAGGLVNGVGGVGQPLALPGSSQVAVAPPGSNNWQWIGTLGRVTALKYGYVCPGGCDKMSMTVMVPASFRTQLFNPGWQVKITRGGHDVWHGKLDEPQPSPSGWNLTAVGQGSRGQDFLAYYAVLPWPTSEPDEILNRAISRGLPWVNPGYNSSPLASQFWFGQQIDPGAQTVTAFLNLLCTRGGLTWYVNSQPGGVYNGDDLQIFPLPTTPNRMLVVSTPVARTLGGDINYILIKYQVTADNTSTNQTATYNFVAATNPQSIAAHGQIETYIDLSDVGVMSSAQAQAVGNYVLQIYQRASFAGPFTGSYGQLLNAGGTPIDPGTDQAGTMVRLILTDYGYGGEVTPQFPITFVVGAYEWDDFAQTFTITPYQNVDQSLTGLLSLQNTIMTPIQAAS